MLFWYPKIKDTGIPMPRTFFVSVSKDLDLLEYVPPNNSNKFPKNLLETCQCVAKLVFYPIFMRTDQLSGKHNWNRTCFVEKEDDLLGQIINLIEESACAGVLGIPINAFVFREFIELDWKFKAFNEMPVARERRYFINNGAVICHHPYWIEDAIRFYRGTEEPENWRKILSELNTETKDEIEILTKMTFKIAYLFDGYWSVDFAKTKHDGWMLIDMALGYDSWHPDCSHKLEINV